MAIRGALVTFAYTLLRARYLIQSQPYMLLSDIEKREEIRRWQLATGYKVFVETGTFLGKTTLAMSQIFDRCFTIEIDENLYARARQLLASRSNITVILGDSGEKLPEVVAQLEEPAIFWLDGHYSKSVTGKGARDTPIEAELHAIFHHRIKEHVILIDDARAFLGIHGYPSVARLKKFVDEHSTHRMRISNDIIRIYHADL
jgi:hypothetical protein